MRVLKLILLERIFNSFYLLYLGQYLGKTKMTPPPVLIWGINRGHTSQNQQAVAGARIYYFIYTNIYRLIYISILIHVLHSLNSIIIIIVSRQI
jgi:hypothetical protein